MKKKDMTIPQIIHAGYDKDGNWHRIDPDIDPRPEEERGDDGLELSTEPLTR